MKNKDFDNINYASSNSNNNNKKHVLNIKKEMPFNKYEL